MRPGIVVMGSGMRITEDEGAGQAREGGGNDQSRATLQENKMQRWGVIRGDILDFHGQ